MENEEATTALVKKLIKQHFEEFADKYQKDTRTSEQNGGIKSGKETPVGQKEGTATEKEQDFSENVQKLELFRTEISDQLQKL